MKLAVIGSRFVDTNGVFDAEAIVSFIKSFALQARVTTIVSGGAIGIDTLAAKATKDLGIGLIEYLPEWDRHGNKAGFLRNKTIIDNCDEVLAIWDLQTKGTKNSIELARKVNKPVTIAPLDKFRLGPL